MSHVFHRNSRTNIPTVSRGEGAYLYDRTGKAYLDGSGGAAVSCLGHGDAHVIDAIKAQLDRIAFAHTGFLTSEPAETLADRLVAVAPGELKRVYFVSGGSEAMEAALKLARQYFIEAGQPQRSRVIARRQSYHGNTLGALATGGNAWRRAPFAPLLMDVSHVSPCYAYRGMQEGETAQGYLARLVAELEAEIERHGPETVMAFVAEPVVGATLGAVPPVAGYFRAVRELCDRHGILLILDEVMCGMGRTGTLFACEQDGIAPDICAIAKGLGAGYQPIGAMLCTARIHDTIAEGSGFFQHGHTYLGHPTACAAAGAVLDRLLDDGLAARVAPLGEALRARLIERFGKHPHVGDIRGRGLFQGIEFVEDRQTKAPFDPARKLHARIKAAAFEAGLICYPMGGTVDGQRGDHVLLAPPFILTEDQLDELVDKLGQAVDSALA
ncbi:aspartate aminotransferase family protein [Roseovarius atlanticus]|uniref:aspartate aminotransferase family protein n=1 Tax=Roseovarius atlanticus TaxID=1641875 RepID=UPI001C93F83A|nr:aspartate aminotransferase family protein [Roseovarius atlanticus]MBY5989867.1 aspartate aminotransferase family protein [Roseovarius atlanticus]MBY6126412.1 aspartate aminotransferase family protein [Roseovarius atlanticus]MBY6150906.1 aspartate aminotransferase family protein [Roseovarius atlanticus]